MTSENVTQVEVEKEKKEIAYYRPTFWKRVSCIVFDALIFALVALGIFICIREIVVNTPKFKAYNDELNDKKIQSGLYLYNDEAGRYQDLMTYLNVSSNLSYGAKELRLEQALDTFHEYLFEVSGEETYNAVIEQYNNFLLDSSLVYENNPYFIIDEKSGEIVKNIDAKIPSKLYVENAYGKYFDEQALGYFVTYVPNVYTIEKYFSDLLLFLEIPLSLFLGCVVIYYIIPLCFLRNKATLGMFLFKIGLVNKNVLSVSIPLFTLRFVIFFFLEILLSLVTFGVPLFVSFSLMAFSKKKQTFHDYMLGIEEVDVESSKIYYSKDEIFSVKESKYDVKNFKLK